MGDLDASDDEDAVLLENPAYENCMHKGLKVRHFSHGPCAMDTNAKLEHAYMMLPYMHKLQASPADEHLRNGL